MLTRDSKVWWLGMLVPILVEVANALVANPADFGIPAGWLPTIRLVALIVGLISGKLATSPLPGKDAFPFR